MSLLEMYLNIFEYLYKVAFDIKSLQTIDQLCIYELMLETQCFSKWKQRGTLHKHQRLANF